MQVALMKRLKRIQGLSSLWELYTFCDEREKERNIEGGLARNSGILFARGFARKTKHANRVEVENLQLFLIVEVHDFALFWVLVSLSCF